MRPRSLNAFLVLAGLFFAALVSCNLIFQKFFSFEWPDWVPLVGGGFAILSVGILPYPLTFLVTDLISEIYGRKRAGMVVFAGLAVSLFTVGVIQLASIMPAQTRVGWVGPWTEAPGTEGAPAWSGEIRLRLRLETAERVLVLGAPKADGPSPSNGSDLARALNAAIAKAAQDEGDAGTGDIQAALGFHWAEEHGVDGSGTSATRGRLVLCYHRPPQRSGSLAIEADGGLGATLPRGESQEVPASRTSDGVFRDVFGSTWRAILASMIAYLFAQYFDVQVYHFWKKLTRGRLLWLRNNFSTITSQFVDSALVITVLFYGDEAWPMPVMIQAILSAWVFKMLVALTDTPFLYLGVWIFTRFDLAPEDSEYARIAAERRMARIPTSGEH